VIGEGLFIFLSVFLASLIILGPELLNHDHYLILKILLIAIVCQTCLYYNDLYDIKFSENFKELSLRLLQSLGFTAIFLSLIYFMIPKAMLGSGIFLISIFFVMLIIILWRFCYTMILNRGLFNQKIILIGSAELLKNIKQEIKNRKDCGYTIAAEYPESKKVRNLENVKNPEMLIGHKYEGLPEFAKSQGVRKVIAGFKERRQSFPINELLKCRVAGIEVIDGNSFYEMLSGKLIVKAINPSWLIFSEGFHKSLTRRILKRSADLILSITLFVLLLPLMAIIAILIKIDSKGPIFFSQERVGQNRKIYQIHKFRSMFEDAEKQCGPVWADENDDRITKVGKIIRKLRLDEFPQIWNVLLGNMSFVGPRPEREFFVDQLEKIVPYYRERHSVKPGITGWAQVCYDYGASEEDATEKLNYDLFYIKNMSFLMDIMIVMRTIKIVLFLKGAR
jgi:sugar transferase (PEP-CTERM system associated)